MLFFRKLYVYLTNARNKNLTGGGVFNKNKAQLRNLTRHQKKWC